MIANIKIHNLPKGIDDGTYEGMFIVVRRLEDCSLWYYGSYETYQRAQGVALEIGNGFVVQKGNENGKKA